MTSQPENATHQTRISAGRFGPQGCEAHFSCNVFFFQSNWYIEARVCKRSSLLFDLLAFYYTHIFCGEGNPLISAAVYTDSSSIIKFRFKHCYNYKYKVRVQVTLRIGAGKSGLLMGVAVILLRWDRLSSLEDHEDSTVQPLRKT